MEEIKSLYVSILEKKPLSPTFLHVHYIKLENDNKLVFDSDEIKRHLYGHQCVISKLNNVFDEFDNKQLLKIDLKDERVIEDEEATRYPKIHHEKPRVENNFLQVIVENDLQITDHIDIDSIEFKSIRNRHNLVSNQQIYILNNEYLFGPFRLLKDNISPKDKKSVQKYTFEHQYLITLGTNTSIYLGTLGLPLQEIDCMSTDQIIEYCKELIDVSTKNRATINDFKEIANKISDGGNDLRQLRVKRIKNIINHITFTEKEISAIAQKKSVWNEIFSEMYQEQKELFIEAFRDQLITEITTIEEQKQTTEEALNEANKKLIDIQQLISENEFNLNRIKEKEQELIDNIKIQANIIGSSSYQQSNTFYERIESSKPVVKNAIELIESNDLTLEEIEQQLFHELIPKEVYYTNNINATLNILKMLNDYCYYLVNVEIDWIKYESLFENGLKQIVNEACNNNERMHFLILNDFNIANLEFYGKPLIDVINKTRSYIPGTNKPLPDNLKFILVETSCDNEEENFPTRCQSINSKSVELNEILIIKDLNRISKKLKEEALFNWNDFK